MRGHDPIPDLRPPYSEAAIKATLGPSHHLGLRVANASAADVYRGNLSSGLSSDLGELVCFGKDRSPSRRFAGEVRGPPL